MQSQKVSMHHVIDHHSVFVIKCLNILFLGLEKCELDISSPNRTLRRNTDGTQHTYFDADIASLVTRHSKPQI